MTIPVGEQYMSPIGGIGKLANYQGTQTDSKAVGADTIRFGQALQVDEDIAKPFSDGNFFGVAIAKNYVPDLTVDKVGEFAQGEMVAVLRKGSIWVQVDEDVKSGEQAAAKTSGNFGVATASDAVGIFQSTAQSGGLAILQINLP